MKDAGKEPLYNRHIRRDLIRMYLEPMFLIILCLLLLWGIWTLIVAVAPQASGMLIFFGVMIALVAGLCVHSVVMACLAATYKFSTQTSVLFDTEEGHGYGAQRLMGLNFRRQNRLYFYPNITFWMPETKYYTWSNFYVMSYDEVFKTSRKDDEFLLVYLCGKHPVMVYNLKFFDYCEGESTP